MATWITENELDTKRTAFVIMKYYIKRGDVVLLKGDLGAGKTTFVKGAAPAVWIDDEITSPTYAYMNEYHSPNGLTLYHYDCYRLENGEQALALGLTDYFNDENGICFIEWSENIQSVLPKKVKVISIEKIDDEKRKITYEVPRD